MRRKEPLVCWGKHRSDTDNAWIKLRSGKEALDDKIRKQRGWMIIYRKKGEAP